jgi:glutaconate CoA-transferase subunit B
LDFVTAAGHVDRVVTPLCLFQRRHDRLAVESIHPGVSPAALHAATGFSIEVDDQTPVTPAPTAAELAALGELDPTGVSGSEF